mmetsp:Transcript_16213/g.47597  ORF Transcript_16213/g.47597 Transcript_16213/m.47597 type:complete len:287 (+) Transcript_16213:619-1479(+)
MRLYSSVPRAVASRLCKSISSSGMPGLGCCCFGAVGLRFFEQDLTYRWRCRSVGVSRALMSISISWSSSENPGMRSRMISSTRGSFVLGSLSMAVLSATFSDSLRGRWSSWAFFREGAAGAAAESWRWFWSCSFWEVCCWSMLMVSCIICIWRWISCTWDRGTMPAAGALGLAAGARGEPPGADAPPLTPCPSFWLPLGPDFTRPARALAALLALERAFLPEPPAPGPPPARATRAAVALARAVARVASFSAARRSGSSTCERNLSSKSCRMVRAAMWTACSLFVL